MKQRKKLILDAVLAALLILLMCYSFTGGLIHEILGITILVGFIAHVFFNRKYYGAVIRAIKKGKCSTKNKIAFIINVILPVDATILLISSFAISHELFPGISNAFGGYSVWVVVHIVFAVILLISVFAHVCMHMKMFTNMVRKAAKNPKVVTAWRAGSRITAVILAILVLKVSVDNVISAAETVQVANRYSAQAEVNTIDIASKEIAVANPGKTSTSESGIDAITESENQESEKPIETEPEAIIETIDEVQEVTDSETVITDIEDDLDNDDQESEIFDIIEGDYISDDDYIAEDDNEDWKAEEAYYEDDTEEYYELDPEPIEPEVSLGDYLSSLTCSGCGKHCSLLSPRCGKGENQAAQATNEYYEIYGA